MQGIDTLRRNGVPFHVICVIGARESRCGRQLVDYFIAEGIRDVGFNIEEIEGVNRGSGHYSRTISTLEISRVLWRLLDRAQAADPPLAVREQRRVACHPPASVVWKANSQLARRIHSVSYQSHRVAGLYTFSPELAGLTDPHYGDLAVGQLPGADLATILAGPAFERIWSDIETGTAMCRRSSPILACASAVRRPTSWPSSEPSLAARPSIADSLTRRSRTPCYPSWKPI